MKLTITIRPLRREAQDRIESWYHEVELSVVKPEHLLVKVQEMHVSEADTPSRQHATESRKFLQSRPPVRELSDRGKKMDRIMGIVGEVEPRYHAALVSFVVGGTMEKVAGVMGTSKATAYRYYEGGIAIVQSRMLDW